MTRLRPLGMDPDSYHTTHQEIVKAPLFGWYCFTTHGVCSIEPLLHAFTRRGIERKAARLARSLHRDDEHWRDAHTITRRPPTANPAHPPRVECN